MLIAGIIIALLLSPAGNKAGDCDNLPFKQLLEGPPRSRYEYRGRYVNWPYEYSVLIPRRLTGYDGRAEANHKGFGLRLGKPPQSYIFVRAEHNSAEYNAPREAATRDVEYLRQDGKKIESETITDSHLGTLNAVRLVVIYTCPGSADRHIKSSIIALSADKGFLYELALYSPANRYESDRAMLNQIIKSWRILSASR
jgi:hypothetical protein